MANSYFIKRGAKINGPFTVDKLQALKKAKKLRASDCVSQSEEGPWKPLSAYSKANQGSEQKNTSPVDSAPKTVACEDCGGVVSRRAKSCPHCGSPVGQPADHEVADNLQATSNKPVVVQLDVLTFLVKDLPKAEVFKRLGTQPKLTMP